MPITAGRTRSIATIITTVIGSAHDLTQQSPEPSALRAFVWRDPKRNDHRALGRYLAHDLRANAFRVCREGKPLHTLPDHALRPERNGFDPARVLQRGGEILVALPFEFFLRCLEARHPSRDFFSFRRAPLFLFGHAHLPFLLCRLALSRVPPQLAAAIGARFGKQRRIIMASTFRCALLPRGLSGLRGLKRRQAAPGRAP